MQSVSIVIPVYNAEMTLPELYRSLIPAMESITNRFEIIMVEDCGPDRSWEIIKQLAANDNRIVGKKLSRNYGQHNALLCGIRSARNEIIVTMDDDLQHPPGEIAKLIDKLEQGYDVVYGSAQQEQHGLWRNIASRLTKTILQSIMGVEAARNVSAFRAFRTQLRDSFKNYRSPSLSIDVLLTWGTSNFGSLEVQRDPRPAGHSNYTFAKLLKHAFDMLTGFSTLPLQIASLIGFLFTIFGFCIFSWVLVNYIVNDTVVPGFPFLASIIAIFSGAQLFAIGIFGEYLARMHFRSMDRPAYTVVEESDSGPATD